MPPVSLVVAIPVGYIVDRQPNKRARLARMSSSLAVISVLSGFIAVLTDELLILTVMLVSFGAFMELSSSATDAIFADSIPAGERSAYYVTKSVLTAVGSACGPGISALGLAMLGDKWQPYQIKILGCLETSQASVLFYWILQLGACISLPGPVSCCSEP